MRARTNAVLMAGVAVVLVVGLFGCGGRGGDAADTAARRELAELDRARLSRQLDVLEVRLVDGRARVAAWGDLRMRHEQVVQVACTNAAWHTADMARALEDERAYARAVMAPRLASASTTGRHAAAP